MAATRERTLSPSQLLTKRFYDWEMRGRGWQVWPYPVSVEPPFVRFWGHFSEPLKPVADDGRKSTFLSRLSDDVRSWFVVDARTSVKREVEEESEPLPDIHVPAGELVELRAEVPREFSARKEAMEQVLVSLQYLRYPLSFEVLGRQDTILIQFACREDDEAQLESQLLAHAPEIVLSRHQGTLHEWWFSAEGSASAVVGFGLSNETMLPLRSVRNLDVDPLTAIVAALSGLGPGEVGALQVLFCPVRFPWAESLMQAVTDWEGGCFFADAPEMLPLTKQKVAKPLFGAVLRVAARAKSHERVWDIAKSLGGALSQFQLPGSNALIPLESDGYPQEIHEMDLLERLTHRSGMILGSDEMVSLVHLPNHTVREPKLLRALERTKAMPDLAKGHELVLGRNVHRGTSQEVTLSASQRLKHMYVIGASGTGKSTLLLSLIAQDLRAGNGLAVLDPHGDLIDQVVSLVPEERLSDVILFDPSDEEYPIGFNILSAHSELEKTLLSSDLVGIFRRLSTSWGDQMNSVLANAILAFLESTRGGTLLTLRRFLVDREFRKGFLPSVSDPEVVWYWEKEFPLLAKSPQAPVLTRLDTFLRPKPIRYMVAQQKNAIDFSEIMNTGQIFLAKLAHGAIGQENASLLGSLLVSKIHQMAIARQEIQQQSRRPFYLYIDEFQHFATPSMESILSGARKYGLGLVLAHQELRQLLARDAEVASSVLSNPYTRVCFRMGDQDAKKLQDGFSFFDAKDLQNLRVGQAIVRIEQAAYDFNLETVPVGGVSSEEPGERVGQVRDHTRATYSTPKEEVEAQFLEPVERAEGEKTKSAWREKERAENLTGRKETKKVAAPVGRERGDEAEGAISQEPVAKDTPSPPSVPRSGRGGMQHRYLQNLLKRLAEEHGYRASIEESILGGTGSVDVSLSKEKIRIACEISVTTTPEHELGNIQKCLASGYEKVFVLAQDPKHRREIEGYVKEHLESVLLDRIFFTVPEEFVAFLGDGSQEPEPASETVRGYKVRRTYARSDTNEKKDRQAAISKVIVQSMKRMRS